MQLLSCLHFDILISHTDNHPSSERLTFLLLASCSPGFLHIINLVCTIYFPELESMCDCAFVLMDFLALLLELTFTFGSKFFGRIMYTLDETISCWLCLGFFVRALRNMHTRRQKGGALRQHIEVRRNKNGAIRCFCATGAQRRRTSVC